MKFNSTGHYQWAIRIDDASPSVSGLKVGPNGNIVVSGTYTAGAKPLRFYGVDGSVIGTI